MPASGDTPLVVSPVTWVDGERSSVLPLPDRGLDFGDGLFETLLLAGGRSVFSDLHFARLARGLHALGFPDCMDTVRAQLLQVEDCVARAGWAWTALRLTVSRGGGPRGYASPQICQPRLIATASELDRDCAVLMSPALLVASSVELAGQPALTGLKHLNRLEQVLAANEARAQGADEALVATQAGHVSAVSSGNIFAVAGGRLLTPPVYAGGIAGTRREKVLREWAPAIGIDVEERTLTLPDIESADEVFYTNSLVGLRPVGQFGSATWLGHDVCKALFAEYRGSLK